MHSWSSILSQTVIILTTMCRSSAYKTWSEQKSPSSPPPTFNQCLHSPRPSTQHIQCWNLFAQLSSKWLSMWHLKSFVFCDLHLSTTLLEKGTSRYLQLRQDLSFWSALWQFLLWKDQSLSSTPAPPRSHHSHPRGSLCCQSRRRDLETREKIHEEKHVGECRP